MLKTLKGTFDLDDAYIKVKDYVENRYKHYLSLYGYKMIETPIIESLDVFKKDNDTSDMVTKEMYAFSLNGHEFICLRPEGTSGVIRSIIEHKNYIDLPIKLGYMGQMFRHERPQKGRQRQFNQLGVENIGYKSALIDAETIALGYFFTKSFGIKSIKVLINTLGDEKTRLDYKMALETYFKTYETCMCADCKNRLYKNPLRILDCKIDREQEFFNNAPKINDYLSNDAKTYFENVIKYLDVLDIPYEINNKLVRGLDYYTDTVFEVVSTHKDTGSQATIFGGGRYDNLVYELGGPKLSGIGFSFGLERLIQLLMDEKLIEDHKYQIDAYIIDMTRSSTYAMKVCSKIRENNLTCEINYLDRSMKSQFKSSEKLNAKYIIIIGEDELNNNLVTIKNVKDKTQSIIKYEDLIQTILNWEEIC